MFYESQTIGCFLIFGNISLKKILKLEPGKKNSGKKLNKNVVKRQQKRNNNAKITGNLHKN